MIDRLEIKASLSITEAGEITGLAWPFGTPDRVGDVIEKGAFGTLPESLPMLWAHDQAQVIGVWDHFAETEQGLEIKGKLLIDDVARAREVRAMIQAKAVSGLSIGFITEKSDRNLKGRNIRALKLHEISVVAVPSHPGAQITTLKSAGETLPHEKEPEMTENTAPALDTKALDDLRARMDRIEAKANRAPQTETKSVAIQSKAFANMLRGGREALDDIERKALTVANDAPGYVLAPEETSAEFIRNLVEYSPVRSIADVRATASHTVRLPKRTGITNAAWTGEIAARSGSTPSFDHDEISIHELTTFVDASNWLLEDAGADVEGEIRLALAEDFGAKESAAFVNGNGIGKPLGFMTASGIQKIDATSPLIKPEEMIAAFYRLQGAYRRNSTWVMNSTMLAHVRRMVDASGTFIWQPAFALGQPETILGRPVVELPDMPDADAGSAPIMLGDFRRGYRIFDRVELQIRIDPFTQATVGQVRFHARRRVGASVIRPDAFVKIALAA